jgi:hypothetical protein
VAIRCVRIACAYRKLDSDIFEQVHGDNLRRMVTQEGLRSLAGRSACPSMYLVMLD